MIYLEPSAGRSSLTYSVLDYSSAPLLDAFWHSDNYHLVLLTDKSIEVLEAKPQSIPVKLVNLSKKNTTAFYDLHNDVLYFLDYQRAADGNLYENLYKLELNPKNFPFLEDIIKTNSE
jgi:hypothetical protein